MAGVALGAGDLISHVVTLAVAACAAILVQHFVVGAARKAIDGSNLPSATIFINLLRALVWAFALLAVLKPVFGVEPTAFITALGVTSLVVSLGLQDTISNLVGGLGLMTARVVKPGDQVGVGSVTGEVVDVTWRSTLVRSRGGSVDLIPNSVLNKTGLTRRTRWQVTCADLPFAVASGNDLDQVAQDIRDAAESLRACSSPSLRWRSSSLSSRLARRLGSCTFTSRMTSFPRTRWTAWRERSRTAPGWPIRRATLSPDATAS